MTLLIHTSSPTIRLGLADRGRLVARDEFPMSRDLASILADRIRQFLAAHHASPSTLRRVIVHVGPALTHASAGRPGGYSTLRVGVTTANALAYALGVPIMGVSGEVTDLAQLLDNGNNLPAAANNVVVPVYAKPPNIGPLPTR